MKLTKFAGLGVCMSAAIGMLGISSAQAQIAIGNDLSQITATTAGVVGWATPNAMGGSDEVDIADDLLYINNGGSLATIPFPISGESFNNNTDGGASGTDYDSGGNSVIASSATINSGPLSNPVSGFQFAIVKYGGGGGNSGTSGGGYVLFYLNDESVELPQQSYSLWWNSNSVTSYGISDYTLFNVTTNGNGNGNGTPVPEASTVMAGALMLLPLGIGAIRALRKERSAARIS